MIDRKITIIGGGNLGSAIAHGLIKSKMIQPSAITVTRRKLNLLEDLKVQGVTITNDNIEASRNADIIILAIKPYQVLSIIEEIKPILKSNQILISLVAGIGLDQAGRICRFLSSNIQGYAKYCYCDQGINDLDFDQCEIRRVTQPGTSYF